MRTEKKESYPLAWPDENWPRTRIQDRRSNPAWKRTANQYRDALATEMERMKAPSFVISSNVPLSGRGQMQPGIEPADVGVAVWFSRPLKEDYSWQDALTIHHPGPTEEMVQDAFRRLSLQYHPDRGGDIEMFRALVRHRDNALAWIRRKQGLVFDHVIACDSFKEVRLNIAAITGTIKAIRTIERNGTSALLERAFKGFQALPEHASPSPEVARV